MKDENYLKEFGEKFKNAIQRLVIEEFERTKLASALSKQNESIQEAIEHANHANKLTSKMPDYHDDYATIKSYLRDYENVYPFVLTGKQLNKYFKYLLLVIKY